MAQPAAAAITKHGAQIFVPRKGSTHAIRVALPKDFKAANFGIIADSVLERIKGLTGCSCMSGIHELIIDHGYEDVINARFG